MAATTDFVGTRVFSDLSDTVASIDTRDSTVVGMAMPLPNADPAFDAVFKMDEPVRISTDDAATVTAMGPGLARDAVNQIISEGIITDMPRRCAPTSC